MSSRTEEPIALPLGPASLSRPALSLFFAAAFLIAAAAHPALTPAFAPGLTAAAPGDLSRHQGPSQLAALAEAVTEQFVPIRATMSSLAAVAMRLGVAMPVAWHPRKLSGRDRSPIGLPLSRGPPQPRLV